MEVVIDGRNGPSKLKMLDTPLGVTVESNRPRLAKMLEARTQVADRLLVSEGADEKMDPDVLKSITYGIAWGIAEEIIKNPDFAPVGVSVSTAEFIQDVMTFNTLVSVRFQFILD